MLEPKFKIMPYPCSSYYLVRQMANCFTKDVILTDKLDIPEIQQKIINNKLKAKA